MDKVLSKKAYGRRFRRFPVVIFTISLFLTTTPASLGQDALMQEEVEATPTELPAPPQGLFFADILARGRPVFQVGGLPELPATERADIINRRIATALARENILPPVTAQTYPGRNIAILQLNHRVLMTVTQQDAEDFALDVDTLAQQWADELNRAFEQPPLFIDVAQRLNDTVRQLIRDTIDNLPSALGALIIVLVTWSIAKGVRRIAFMWAQRTEGDSSTEILIARLGYGGVWVVGSIVALGVLGLDFGALLGALGLTTVAIGFSLKDILGNYISGVILLAARPFRIGDQIVIKEYEGTVTQIQLRGTSIRTYDGRIIYIPNQQVFNASITNNTAENTRRSSITVGIDYAADLNQVKQVVTAAIKPVEGVEEDRQIDVLVRELAASTVNIEVRFWVNPHRMAFLETTSQVAQAMKEALMNAGIEMPTEIYTLDVRTLPDRNGSKPNHSDSQDGQASRKPVHQWES